MHPTIGMITNNRKSAGRSIKDLIAESRILLDKLDDAFEGMVDDDDFLTDGLPYGKLKGVANPKIKSQKVRAKIFSFIQSDRVSVQDLNTHPVTSILGKPLN